MGRLADCKPLEYNPDSAARAMNHIARSGIHRFSIISTGNVKERGGRAGVVDVLGGSPDLELTKMLREKR